MIALCLANCGDVPYQVSRRLVSRPQDALEGVILSVSDLGSLVGPGEWTAELSCCVYVTLILWLWDPEIHVTVNQTYIQIPHRPVWYPQEWAALEYLWSFHSLRLSIGWETRLSKPHLALAA